MQLLPAVSSLPQSSRGVMQTKIRDAAECRRRQSSVTCPTDRCAGGHTKKSWGPYTWLSWQPWLPIASLVLYMHVRRHRGAVHLCCAPTTTGSPTPPTPHRVILISVGVRFCLMRLLGQSRSHNRLIKRRDVGPRFNVNERRSSAVGR